MYRFVKPLRFGFSKVHEIRDLFWDGIPYRGASWLREEPIQEIWKRVILVPTTGGLIVAAINALLRLSLDDNGDPSEEKRNPALDLTRVVSRPFLKALAACVTLGTGTSLGPEGPSVEIGASLGKGVSSLIDTRLDRKLSLVAAGSAAGIASGLCSFIEFSSQGTLNFCFLFYEISIVWLRQGSMLLWRVVSSRWSRSCGRRLRILRPSLLPTRLRWSFSAL